MQTTPFKMTHFIKTQNRVCTLGYIDCDAFYIGLSSREISTRSKEHARYARKPNNMAKLQKLQIRSAIEVHFIPNNHEVGIKKYQKNTRRFFQKRRKASDRSFR